MKKTAKKSARQKRLPPLTGVRQQVVSHVLNNLVFDNYGDCCSVDAIAKSLQRTPGGMKRTLSDLVEGGYLTMRGETLPWVYPTATALRHQDPSLSEVEAEKIVANLQRGHPGTKTAVKKRPAKKRTAKKRTAKKR
jgi:hypothetical protein